MKNEIRWDGTVVEEKHEAMHCPGGVGGCSQSALVQTYGSAVYVVSGVVYGQA